ncbi:MAG: diacylglycerol kinase family lipid kinase [Anaerolineae bacterium]|nr:diacylglycerol kinase family lipid kinase [Phycisphaerae bacterium]
MNTVLIFANPIAGQGRGKRIAEGLRTVLYGAGFDVRVFFDRPDDITRESMSGSDDRLAAAISIGGDGTLRGVVQRLVELFSAESMPTVVVVPLGTANLMSKHLGVDWSERRLQRDLPNAIAERRIKLLDAATANGKLFLLMAGVGIDAHIVHELDRVRTGPIDITSYALPAALAFQSYSYSPIEVEVDGRKVFGPAPALAFAGNVAEYGTGFPVLPLARSDDGLLDVCVLPCASRVDLIRLALLVATGDHLRAEGVIYTTAKTIRITAVDDVPVQVDGEPGGHLPLEIEMLPRRIPFLVQ